MKADEADDLSKTLAPLPAGLTLIPRTGSPRTLAEQPDRIHAEIFGDPDVS
jgi:hypothetical protein